MWDFVILKGMEIITSRNNKTVINAAKYKEKKHRDADGIFCFEGRKLFYEAISSAVELISVFVTEKTHKDVIKTIDLNKTLVYTVTDTVFEKLTNDKAPDGIFCLARKKQTLSAPCETHFILSSVRDPGNLGTCIRTAKAFGIDNLILHDCADEFNPKVIRASMGAFFRQNISHSDDIISTIETLTKSGYEVFPTALTENSIELNQINITKKTVFIIGNEGHGISKDVIDTLGGRSVIIPMPGGTESLNASVAASVLMWEISKVL